MRYRTISVLTLLAVVTACNTDAATTAMQPPRAPENGSVAFVTVSDAKAAVGSAVTVTAVVHNDAPVSSVGAFTARLTFDAAGLTYVGEQALPSGMRAINAQGSEILAAGASARGFDDGKLFALTFKVVNPVALESIKLEITELNGTDFSNHVPKLSLQRGVFRAPAL